MLLVTLRGATREASNGISGRISAALVSPRRRPRFLAAPVADQLHDRVRKPGTCVGGALARGGRSIHTVNRAVHAVDRARHVAMRQAHDDREPETATVRRAMTNVRVSRNRL
jgi:hypothetical protein